MTTEQIDPEHWRLNFPEHEAAFIVNILARLGRQYQEDPKHMTPALRAFWDGSITKGEAANKQELGELADAQQLLSESRTELRSQRLNLVENWIQEYELAENRDPWQVEVTSAERDEFIAMLNDRRLLLAFNIGVTEADMEGDPSHISEEARRHAILEIDVLGHFILVMLGPQIHRP
jgi:hypothetical protein